MVFLGEESLEWALKHLTRYYDSDFCPVAFEFSAIKQGWTSIKSHLRSIDLDEYTPQSPLIHLAPKANGTFRVVHRLDPIDSLLYTALVYEVHRIIEDYRIPESESIACSYRIKPDVSGSFFDREETGWDNFTRKTELLADEYVGGYVLTCDIADFYNQIYLHRIQNVLAEAGPAEGEPRAKAIECFLTRLNTKTSRGVPVGPAASIVLAEAIMADIDKKILAYTHDFVRWVDDIRIFLSSEWEATYVLHELTRYLYSNHRLVLSGEKTLILQVKDFKARYFRDREAEEKSAISATAEVLALDQIMAEMLAGLPAYEAADLAMDIDVERERIHEKISELSEFEVLSKAYLQLLDKMLSADRLDMTMLRRIFRVAARHRIRSILPLSLTNFTKLLPVVREVVIYLYRVVNEEVVKRHWSLFQDIMKAKQMSLPFVNMWVSFLLTNSHFAGTDIPNVLAIRDRALIARRDKDTTWVKSYKDGLDNLPPWDRRAVLYSASILSSDELKHWASLVAGKGDPLDKALAEYVVLQH